MHGQFSGGLVLWDEESDAEPAQCFAAARDVLPEMVRHTGCRNRLKFPNWLLRRVAKRYGILVEHVGPRFGGMTLTKAGLFWFSAEMK